MFFKVDFAKAYDSARWDYLIDVLGAFGFGLKWCQWIRGDPLAPLLFILVIESLHLSFSRVVEAGMFKAPKGVLKEMESIRNNFFIGADPSDKKITWIAWDKVLASKIKGGLGVSSFFALNRALILKWVWRFVSQDGSLWFHVIVGDGNNTSFWFDIWKGDSNLHDTFPRIFALETDKQSTVAGKIAQVDGSFRRPVQSGLEQRTGYELVSLYLIRSPFPLSQDVVGLVSVQGDGDLELRYS
ncbi:hypothetical protein Tco_1438729 [Tanacetum coccineum]